jgi:DHA2 family multidrug resistance protein
MPPRLWAYGIAIYALNLELSLNISASLEGWYIDNLSWRWIFWQNIPLALAMAACLHFGVRSGQPPPTRLPTDIYGLTSCGVGLALIYAALDQGNRLDWTSSGLIWGLLIAGAVMLIGFVVHDLTAPNRWLDLRAAFAPPMPYLFALIALVRLAVLSTAFLIPQYLTAVRGFRALEVGQTLLWIAAPQLLVCPLSGFLLRRADPRISSAFGLCLVIAACMLVAFGLTPVWGDDQFLLSQLLQSLGQSLVLAGIVFLGVMNMRPEAALPFGAMLQTARLLGGELGQAFVATLVRVREQHASNLIGQHVRIGDIDVQHRLEAYRRVLTRAGHQAIAAPELLAALIRRQANTVAVIDAFVAIAGCIAFGLIVLVLVPPPPRTPASHVPLFRRKKAP